MRAVLLAAAISVFAMSMTLERILNPPDPDVTPPKESAPSSDGTVAPSDETPPDGTVFRPRGVTSGYSLQHTEVVYNAFIKESRNGLSVSDLVLALPVVNVQLSPSQVDLAHRAFDLDRDEALDVNELMALINSERGSSQRAWRMFSGYGWILFTFMILSNSLTISWVEGRMFSSSGAYSRYIEMDLKAQRSWDFRRKGFLARPAFWSRCRYYLGSYIGGVVFVTAAAVSGGSLSVELVWWFVAILLLAPVVSWLLLRVMDWINSKQRRLLHKRRLGSWRMKTTQRNHERQHQIELRAQAGSLSSVVGGSRRKSRVPRADRQKRKAEFKADLQQRKERITQQKQELAEEIQMLEEALQEDDVSCELRERAQVQLNLLQNQMKELAPQHHSARRLQQQSEASSEGMTDQVSTGVQAQLQAKIDQVRKGISSLKTPKERANAQKKIADLQGLMDEVVQ